MKCTTCGNVIIGGFFTALIKGEKLHFHIQCRPVFYYTGG